jgi:DNA-binding transcriptional LysR family regulator
MLDVTRLRIIDAVARHGSVTNAAKELHYSQPSVSHHLARLEAETGAQLLQRVGRGIRLTQAGQLLADRAAEIIGRIDAADAELSAHLGLTAGHVRLAGFSSAIGSLVPRAVAALASKHPDLQISLTDTHPPEALELLRAGKVDVAVIFRYDESEPSRTTSACTTCSTIPSTCSPPAESASSPPCATQPGSPAASAAAATYSRSAPARDSSRESATPPTTWS